MKAVGEVVSQKRTVERLPIDTVAVAEQLPASAGVMPGWFLVSKTVGGMWGLSAFQVSRYGLTIGQAKVRLGEPRVRVIKGVFPGPVRWWLLTDQRLRTPASRPLQLPLSGKLSSFNLGLWTHTVALCRLLVTS
jgi:hypothetical protein